MPGISVYLMHKIYVSKAKTLVRETFDEYNI